MANVGNAVYCLCMPDAGQRPLMLATLCCTTLLQCGDTLQGLLAALTIHTGSLHFPSLLLVPSMRLRHNNRSMQLYR